MRSPLLILLFLCVAFMTARSQSVDAVLNSLQTDRQKADTLLSLGTKTFLKFKLDSANVLFNRGLNYAKELNDPTLLARYYIAMSGVPRLQDNSARALEIIKKASPYISDQTVNKVRENYLLFTAYYYGDINQNDSALFYYQKTEKLHNQYWPYGNWSVYEGMSQVFRRSQSYDKAEEYLMKAYAITKAANSRKDHGMMLYTIGSFYTNTNQSEKFAAIFNEYNAFIKAGKSVLMLDPVHSLLMIDWGDRSLEQKISYIEKIKEFNLKNNFLQGAAYSNFYLATLFEEDKQYSKAIELLKENETKLIGVNELDIQYFNAKQIFRIQQKAGLQADALKTADKLFVLNSKLADAGSKEIALNLEKKYETEKKDQEIVLLNARNALNARTIDLLSADKKLAALQFKNDAEQRLALERENGLMDSIVDKEKAFSLSISREKNNEAQLNAALGRENSLKETELGKERKLRWSLMGGALVLLLSGISIFVLYRKQKGKNAIIQKQSDNMEILIKEIHHRVKNNMQVVSSLLDLQSLTIKDVQASEAVKEGKNRVQSMALIHQNLYSEDNLKGIKAKEYIGNLMQSLCDSYNISNDKIKIVTDIEDLNLDIDTMIPLGLILNELLSNVFKYAFPKDAMNKQTNIGELNLVLKKQNENLYMKVYDNGIGFPEGLDTKNSKSFGLKMIKAFAQKLKAKVDIYNNNGAVVEMLITKYQMA